MASSALGGLWIIGEQEVGSGSRGGVPLIAAQMEIIGLRVNVCVWALAWMPGTFRLVKHILVCLLTRVCRLWLMPPFLPPPPLGYSLNIFWTDNQAGPSIGGHPFSF